MSTPTISFISIDPKRSQSISGQITEQIRQQILSGRLKRGDSLPSTRILCKALGCSRNTVIAAYRALTLEGLIESSQGRGSIVADNPPKMLPHPIIGTKRSREVKGRVLTERAKIAEVFGQVRAQELIPFALAYPSHNDAPPREWYAEPVKLFKNTWSHMSYEFPAENTSLAETLCDYVRRTRSIVCEPEQIVITDNFWQGTQLACQILFEPGDGVIITDPCRSRHKELLQYLNLKPYYVPLTERGLDWYALEKSFEHAKGIILSPSEMFPFGLRLSFTDRARLLGLAQQAGAWIVEKDNGKEFFTNSTCVQAIYSLDETDSVVYIDSFTRMLYPSINVGFIIVPKWLAKAMKGAKYLNDIQTPKTNQQLVRHAIESGFLDKRLRCNRNITRNIRLRLVGKLRKSLAAFGHLHIPADAPYVVLILDTKVDDVQLCRFLKEKHRIESYALSRSYLDSEPQKGLILGFAGMEVEAIDAAVHRLQHGVAEFLSLYSH